MAKSKEGMKGNVEKDGKISQEEKAVIKYGKVKNGQKRRKRKKKEDGIEFGRSENKRDE